MRVSLYLLAVVPIALAGCNKPVVDTPKYDPAAMAKEAMATADANSDGKIAAEELEKSPGLKAMLPQADADHNATLSEAEIAERIKKYGDSAMALVPFKCQVLLDGHPLADAKVTLTPEKFLASVVEPAEGTTNKEGYAVLSVAKLSGKGLSGVRYGAYRIEISKKDGAGKETLPAKFNTETTLGQEVASDVRELEHGVTIKLSSR